MFSLIRSMNKWLVSTVSVVFIIGLFFVLSISAQVFGDRSRTGGTGGSHTILGRIYYPSGRPVEQFRVRLESTNSTTLSTFTNQEGVFTFNSLEPGNYMIIVETSDEYEPNKEALIIDKETNKSTARTFNVVIYLRLKGSPQTKPSVINAKLANVPKNALEQYEKALKAVSENNPKKAVEFLNKAIELYPQFGEAYSEIGSLYLKLGELDKALNALKKALSIDSENVNAHLNYGIALLNNKQMPEAEEELKKVVAVKTDTAVPRMYHGIALIGLKRIDEAEAELKKAIELGKGENIGQAHKYLGGIYWQRNDFKQAADHLEKYVELNPKAADAERIKTTVKELRSKT